MTDGDRLGATWLGDGRARFVVWAPKAQRVDVVLAEGQRVVSLEAGERGYFHGTVDGLAPQARYWYRLNGTLQRPDPASRWQPDGVHGPSAIVPEAFAWQDQAWQGLALEQSVLYELHVGTFTPEGTFDAAIAELPRLSELGITALELMPVAQCPGSRNWGYDGVYLFAPQASYGGPEALRRFVDACHRQTLGVVLDVVYNHFGPEGNYTGDFGWYTTEVYHTPWGAAMNFDGPHSDEVRRFFLENARQWLREFHVDALRLDAVHAIIDRSARPFLEELSEFVDWDAHRQGRPLHLIAESDLNDARLLMRRSGGGIGLHAQWNDDFHHALHALLTGERNGYYQDFGRVADLAKALTDGYVYAGQHSTFRQRRHGRPLDPMSPMQLVVYSQNHDQVGNRLLGDRLAGLVSFEHSKLAAAAVMLSPFIPMLFMGEETGERAPFAYFVSHSDERLIEAVRRGRREEFRAFAWKGRVPDPQAEETFLRAKLTAPGDDAQRRALSALYRQLIEARSRLDAIGCLRPPLLEVRQEGDQTLVVSRRQGSTESLLILHFGAAEQMLSLPRVAGAWMLWIDTAASRWAGPAGNREVLETHGNPTAVSLAPVSCLLLVHVGDASRAADADIQDTRS